MGFLAYIYQDKQANIANPTKGKYIVVLFRIAQLIRRRKGLFILFFWYLLFYRVVVEWFMCVELSWKTNVGPGLSIWHGSGLVIHPDTIIGSNFTARQCTTIGIKQDASGQYSSVAPVIGNNVDVGSNSVIVGPVTIGHNVKVGAGSVVVKSVPENATVVGNPARIINQPAVLQ